MRRRPQAASAEACQRNRKKCRPQREHLQGWRIHRNEFSMEFRTPTLLNSIDLQCGHRVENTALIERTSALSIGLRPFGSCSAGLIPKWPGALIHGRPIQPRASRPARLLGRLALFRRAHVRLRQPDSRLRAGYVSLMPLLYSLVHRCAWLIPHVLVDQRRHHGLGRQHE